MNIDKCYRKNSQNEPENIYQQVNIKQKNDRNPSKEHINHMYIAKWVIRALTVKLQAQK